MATRYFGQPIKRNEDPRLLTDLATGYEKLGSLFLARRAFGR